MNYIQNKGGENCRKTINTKERLIPHKYTREISYLYQILCKKEESMMKKSFFKLLVVFFIISLLSTTLDLNVMASYEFIPPEGNFIVSSKKTTLVPGVVETEIIYNTPDGSNPVSGFMVDINLGSSVNIMAATTNYNQTGTQIVREMAKAAGVATGRNIVAAINADLNWNGTGLSDGPTIVDGKVITDKPAPFFGIKKNGEAIIGDANKFLEVKDELVQAVKGMGWLIKDNQIVATSDSLAPRTAVGLRADGTVFFYVVEGRMYPRSVGISLKDLAQIMHSYGAVMALNMDGGGSTTYLAKREGESSLELRNKPSDGAERASISSLLVYANTGDGVFHHAAITTEGDIYTPNSEIQFMARGVDSAGGHAELPKGLTWKLADDRFGTIDETGKFLSNGTEGTVVVYLEDSSGRKVGEGSVEIRTPDGISFRSDEFSLGFEETTDFGIRVTYRHYPVIIKDGDIIWEYDERLGSFNNNVFTSNSGESINGVVRATITNTDISKEFNLVVGKLPIVIFDFENDLINEKWEASSVNGAKSEISIVHRDSGEPVRFGNKSLRVDFDYTEVPKEKNPSGAYAGFTDREGLEELGVTFQLPGSPKSIGMWIYGTEESQGLWLRTGIGVNGTTAWKAFDLTTEKDGINWLGWKYVEVDLTEFGGPYTILPGQFIRLMITAGSFNKEPLRPIGNIYVDNITVSYGTNPEDYNPPIIDSVKINNEEVENEQVIKTNNVTIETSFYEYEEKNATDIDFENVSIYVDGVNYLNKEGYALDITGGKAYLQNVFLTDGIHEIKVVVMDNAGNETVERRYITVNTGANNKVYLESSDEVVIGKDYIIELKTDEIDNINRAKLSLQISKTLSNFEVEFSDAFTGDVEYLNGVRILNINAERISNDEVDYICRIRVPIDSTLTDNAVLMYRVNIGEFEYIQDNTTGLFLKSFSALPKNLKVVAPLKISTNIILVGHEAIIKVTDSNGNNVENAEVFLVQSASSKRSLGFTDENGILVTTELSSEIARFTLVAKLNDEVSFEYKGQAYGSIGDENGTPLFINLNGVKNPEESKNITWVSNAFALNNSAIIQYALKTDYDLYGESAFLSKEGSSELYVFNGSQDVKENYVVNINNVVIDGLTSGKEYVYRVGNGEFWSELRTFNTLHKNSDVNFLVMGDVQTLDFAKFRSALSRIALNGIDYDFAIQVGDIIDDAGHFNQWKEVLSAISDSTLGNIDIIHVLGNHEYYGDNDGEKARALFNLPKDSNNYYSAVYGNVYVAVFDYGMSRDELIEALEWLVQDSNQAQAKWRILVSHQPPYYTNPQGNGDLFRELVPSYAERAGIDFVFSGHDHAYARTKPLINGVPDKDGIVYIVSGALGEKRYTSANNPDFYFDVMEDTENSVYITVEANETSFKVTTREVETGVTIDSYTKTKIDDHIHSFYIEGDILVCSECGYTRLVSNYIGFVRTYDENIMYFINGEPYKGLFAIGKDLYYFDEETGFARTGKTEVWGLETVFDEEGRFLSGGTGFVKIGDNTLYYRNLRFYKSGWATIDGYTYYFSYENGYMRTGRTRIGEFLYDFTEDGKLIRKVTSEFIKTDAGTYYLDEDGYRVYGWQEINGDKYYFSTSSGYMRTGRATIDGVLYDFDEDGKLIGEVKVGFIKTPEGTYYLTANGTMLKGWQEIDGATYYFSYENGYMRTGRTRIGGELYDFDEDGKLIGKVQTGFIETPEGTYYLTANGTMLKGWQEIDGATYYFSYENGYMRTGITRIGKVLYEFGKDGKLIGPVTEEESVSEEAKVEGQTIEDQETDESIIEN